MPVHDAGFLRREPSPRADGRRRKRNSFEDEKSALVVAFEFALMDGNGRAHVNEPQCGITDSRRIQVQFTNALIVGAAESQNGTLASESSRRLG